MEQLSSLGKRTKWELFENIPSSFEDNDFLSKNEQYQKPITTNINFNQKNHNGYLLLNERDFFVHEIQKRGGLNWEEKWDTVTNIPAKIIALDKKAIQCECVLDRQNFVFEKRIFPISLVSHLYELAIGGLLQISIKEKPGSMRIDIFNGEGLVNKDIFDIKEDLENLKNMDLGKPFSL